MADPPSSGDLLKTFAAKANVSSVRERTMAIRDVAAAVTKGAIPEAAVKGIFKFLAQALPFYRDELSRRAALELVSSVIQTHFEASFKALVASLEPLAESHRKNVTQCRSSSGEAVQALTWSCVLLRQALKTTSKSPALEPLLTIQAGLVYGAVSCNNKPIKMASYRKLRRIWHEVPNSIEKYADVLASLEKSAFSLPLISYVMKFLSSKKQSSLLEKYKKPFLEVYITQVLASRTKPQRAVILNCGDFLRHCTHEEFKDQVLPAAQKAVLRSSEVILDTVSELLTSVILDLSQYATDVMKLFAGAIASKDEATRAVAVQAVKNLAQQCSDPGAVEKIASLLFKVLGGSEGKLTFADQKISVLQGIGNLVYNTVSGTSSLQSLATTISEMFLPILQQEVHEGTLIHTLMMLSLWCAKFYDSLPDKLVQWFKKGLGLKTSTSLVRSAYIHCMNVAFHGDTLQQAPQVVPLLLQTLDKASKQASQAQLVTEGLVASCLLVKIAAVDVEPESKLAPFWTMVLDKKKQYFVNEKFINSISSDALQNLVFLIEKLTLDFPTKMTDTIARPYYKALIYCLNNRSWDVRRPALASTKKILSLLGGSQISLALIHEFESVMQTQKLSEALASPIKEEDGGGAKGEGSTESQSSSGIRPAIVATTMLTICGVERADPKEADKIALASLIPAHHPCVVHTIPQAWIQIMQKLKIDPSNFVNRLAQQCLDYMRTGVPLSESQMNAVSTLALLSPDVIAPQLVEYCLSLLTNPPLSQITQDDYGIFMTPEGELYDNTIIENATKTIEGSQNVRRENKLYSYAEQMAEIELRKELDKTKGKKTTEGPKLTKKQEEQVAAIRQREQETREKMIGLNSTMQCACNITKALVKVWSPVLSSFIKNLFDNIISLLRSPLAAPSASDLLICIGKTALPDNHIGELVAYAILRLTDPQCSIDQAWTQETLPSQIKRVLKSLHAESVGLAAGTEERSSSSFGLSAPVFCYCLHLMRLVLKQGGAGMKGGHSNKILELIHHHAKMRRQEEDPQVVDVYDPDLLPREQCLDLCLKIVGVHPKGGVPVANDALLELSRCANGEEGSTVVTSGEIDILLNAVENSSAAVREIALKCLIELSSVLPDTEENYEQGLSIAKHVWIACHDIDVDIQEIACTLRSDLGLDDPPEDLCAAIADLTTHAQEPVRQAAACSLAEVLEAHPSHVSGTVQTLIKQFDKKLYIPPPKVDDFGRKIEQGRADQWTSRKGIAYALEKLAPQLHGDLVSTLFSFYVPKGLNDRNAQVRLAMRDAAIAALQVHGKENVGLLLPLFEETLIKSPDTASYDPMRQSIVILMGSLARHLEADNPKVKPIVARLIAVLSTPSKEVQEAVAGCLPELVPSIRADAPGLVSKLLVHLLESTNYGERKGAAYGLAGLIKGIGIIALKQQNVMTTLTEAIQDEKTPRKKEGALMAFEMLCTMLGRLFEPYIVHIVQHLLVCFGDDTNYVRQAADDCAKAVMKNLTPHGVKLVLPYLLKGLEEERWRTKAASVNLLGVMAFWAPKQLSACLPSIVPKLTEVLTDSHVKVQKAGSQALKQIGAVIRNPEIQSIVPDLLSALQDPSKHTTICLEKLLQTKFVHVVDAPSLALIMPVIQRAFEDRVTDTRKMAAQIMGNMYSLTDQKDLSPYLPSVIPGLKQCLLDPVPEVRSVSARALGAMVRGMGEETFQSLMPWLMERLVSEISSVDRSGAAQGLSEVIGGMGEEKLQKVMEDIIQTAERSDLMPHVRDGYIMTYIFLPPVFGNTFVKYVGPILPSILQALADENEFVRDTALRAGKRIINQYADTAVELLLPELERGLFADNWRIRNSSVQLLGDLLYKVSGVSGKMTTETADEDDNLGTESSHQAIMKSLGHERRNRVLSGLYMGRSDTALMVRQNSLHVWKIIVSNTPRTLREILPTLFTLLLGCLASTSNDKRTVAARTLGDLVRKLGERVLPEIIPILESGLDSQEADQRQGVCIGLTEIMASTSKEHVSVFADSLVPTVRRALVDPLSDVRSAAAHTFDNLHHNIGQRALDEILPYLLEELNNPEISERALDGLTQVMAVKSRVVLPFLVPQLIAPPINSKALSLLSSVAGEALTKHLGKILPALMSSLSELIGTPEADQELDYCRSVVLSVEDDTGVRFVMEDLLSNITHNDDTALCTSAVLILHAFCAHTGADISDYLPQLFRGLIGLFSRNDPSLVLAAWTCLDAITKKVDLTDYHEHIGSVRQALKFTLSDYKGKELPGFSIPKKGIAPILPIFREGLLNGGADVKEVAALGLGEVIAVTGAEALKPSVINITGPLIRILGDRFAASVKVAVLDTLSMLLVKVGLMLKPFLPQLQTTFVKAINDPNRAVRLRAASALGKLILIHTRADPLFNELISGFKNAEDASIKDTFVQALRACIKGAGAKMADASRKQLTQTLIGMVGAAEDSTRMTTAGCLGQLCLCLPEAELTDVMIQHLTDSDASLDWTVRHGRSMALSVAIKEAPTKLWTPAFRKGIVSAIASAVTADRIPICLSGIRAAGHLLHHILNIQEENGTASDLETMLIKSMKKDSNDVKILVGRVVTFLADGREGRFHGDSQLIPALVNGTKEKNTVVKSCSEGALVSVLRLRQGGKDNVYQEILKSLDTGMQDSLKEVMTRSLRKLADQNESPLLDIDDTILQ